MTKSCEVPDTVWQTSKNLSPRVKRLRVEYFSFYDRYDRYTNEVDVDGDEP